ncbi:MAG: YfhO family protein, partial [Candidatus Eremiobacterota bacterium]
KKKIFSKLKNLSVIALFTFLVLMHILIPFVLNRDYHAQSVYDSYWKWYSYGMEPVLEKCFNGELLDNKRFPVLTILAVAGFLISISRNRDHYRTSWFIFLFGFLAFFGKPFWGEFINVLFPMGESLHLHRFINIFDFGSVMLAGIALAWLWQKIDYSKDIYRLLAGILLTLIAVFPAFHNRFDYSRENLYWIKDNEKALAQDFPDFSSVMEKMKDIDYVRVYPGLRAGWGKDFKAGKVQVYSMLPVNKINALGYLPFTWSLNADIQCFFDESRYSHYRLFNIGYVLCDPNMKFPAFVKEIEKQGKYSLRHIEGTGYFDLIDVPVLVKGNKKSVWVANLLWLRSNYVDKGQHMAIDFENRLNPADFKRTILMKDRVTFIEDKKEKNLFAENIFDREYHYKGDRGKILSFVTDGFKYEACVDAEKECYLMFKMTYHPNWHVTVDGKEADKIQVSPYFTGVKISEGNHKVTFYYDPGTVKRFLLVTGIVSMIALFFLDRYKFRKKSEQ